MIRIRCRRSVCATITRRLRLDIPIVMYRPSASEWSGSGTVVPSRSPKTVAASSNEVPCLRRFRAAFFGSHSNSTEKRVAAYLSIGKLVASIGASLDVFPFGNSQRYEVNVRKLRQRIPRLLTCNKNWFRQVRAECDRLGVLNEKRMSEKN
jgi:hypothetical protein